MADVNVRLPHQWRPRPYQRPLWDYLERGGKRAVAVWHRRGGKDTVGLHRTTVAAFERQGLYWHMLPSLAQGRKVVWDGISGDGSRMLDAWPKPLIRHIRHDEMKVELVNGSIWQVVGSDNYDSLVGANPVGVIFSEYSVADPRAWDYIRPIIAENGGWAAFLYTPRGRNHGAVLSEMARINPDWHYSLLTVEDTGAIPLEAVDEERRAGMSEDMIRQEFYCSFEASLRGAIYGEQMAKMLSEGRLTRVPVDDHVPVETAWDLGHSDATAIWFVQRAGREFHLIDYYEDRLKPLPHYVKVLQDKGYVYGAHWFPPDVAVHEFSTGKSREETFRSLGVKAEVVPPSRVADGVEELRSLLGRCWVDETRCARGVDALRSYRYEYNEARKDYRDEPVHDWSSHGCDALRIFAMSRPRTKWQPIQYQESGVI